MTCIYVCVCLCVFVGLIICWFWLCCVLLGCCLYVALNWFKYIVWLCVFICWLLLLLTISIYRCVLHNLFCVFCLCVSLWCVSTCVLPNRQKQMKTTNQHNQHVYIQTSNGKQNKNMYCPYQLYCQHVGVSSLSVLISLCVLFGCVVFMLNGMSNDDLSYVLFCVCLCIVCVRISVVCVYMCLPVYMYIYILVM